MEIRSVSGGPLIEEIFDLRREVFVLEQRVDPSEEFDGLDGIAIHMGAYIDGRLVGCGRMRLLDGRAKLERIAVIKEMRGRGIGRSIVECMMERSRLMGAGSCYLHSQLTAVHFYERCGFRKKGDPFVEAGISHYIMEEIRMDGGTMPERSSIPEEYRWDLTDIYETDGEWTNDLEKVRKSIPLIEGFKGRLMGDPNRIAECFRLLDSIEMDMERLYLYSHLKHDEDLNDQAYQALYERARALSSNLSEASSFIVPEILTSPDDMLEGLPSDERLLFANVPLRQMLRMRKHYLDERSEMLLAMGEKPLGAVSRTFRMLNDADLVFGSVKDGGGNVRELTHARYGLYLMDPDRVLRANAFSGMLGAYRSLRNTMASLITGEMESRRFFARTRKYSSALEYALDPDEVTPAVYRNVIDAVSDFLPALHEYMRIRKEIMGLDELHMYDLYVPLVGDIDKEIPYEEARELVISSLSPVGEEFVKSAKELLFSRRIDLLESKGKRSGAYSSSCYDRPPYILMNYTGRVKDLFTLSHEMGHSMHSLIANRSQPHIQADYPILLAEVASNLNEALLSDLLIRTWTEDARRAYLLNHELEEARTSVFRQCMFAEFEEKICSLVEDEEPLTPDLLCDIYGDLNRKYYGPEVIIDDLIRMEWARIPHFYYDFYVYKYVTGYCCARSIAGRILSGDGSSREGYISMLSSGGSLPPLEALKLSGVDLLRPDPINEALSGFETTMKLMHESIMELR